MGPALAATPESRWPLESGGETQPPPWPGTPVAAAEEHRGQIGRPRGSRGAAGAAAQAGACGRPTPSGTDPRAACPRISLRENCAACPWAHSPAAASPCSLTLSLGGSAPASGRCGSWLREVQDRTPSPGPPGMMPVQQSCLCWLREVWTDSDPVASGKAGERQAQSPPLPGGPSPLARTRQAWPDPMTVGKPRGAWGLQWETRSSNDRVGVGGTGGGSPPVPVGGGEPPAPSLPLTAARERSRLLAAPLSISSRAVSLSLSLAPPNLLDSGTSLLESAPEAVSQGKWSSCTVTCTPPWASLGSPGPKAARRGPGTAENSCEARETQGHTCPLPVAPGAAPQTCTHAGLAGTPAAPRGLPLC